jgi:4'-phosphopantetheinyl transferase
MQPPIVWSVPATELTLSPGEICIWKALLDREPDIVRNLAEVLSPDERARATRFHFARDRDRFIVGRGILRELLGAYLRSSPERIHFRYGLQGKPALDSDNGSSAIGFNVSHTRGLALFAFARGRQVGIDLECIRTDFKAEELAQRYFSESEREELSALSAASKAEAFFLCWTRKEAYIKACGEGLHTDLKSFGVTLTPNRPAKFTAGVPSRWQLQAFFAAERCPAAVVYQGTPCPNRFFLYREPLLFAE